MARVPAAQAAARARIEADTGLPLGEALTRLARRGHSRNDVADQFGIPVSTFKRLAAHYPDVPWPPRNQTRRYKASRKRLVRKARAAYLRQNPDAVRVRVDGRLMTLPQAARARGLHRSTVARRYHRWGADDVERLLAPSPERRLDRSEWVYRLDLSADDWAAVLDYARRRGTSAARQKFDVPQGAIRAMLRGQEHLID